MFTRALDALSSSPLPERSNGANMGKGCVGSTRVEWVFMPSVEIKGSAVQSAMAQKLFEDFQSRPLFLPSEVRRKFGDICARLWPVFHGIATDEYSSASAKGTSWAGGGGRESMGSDAVAADMEGLDAYRVVSEHFAQAVAGIYNPGDLILVYDFELLLLPQMLRRRITDDATIGIFLDCPFPSPEFFRKIPVRSNLLRGVLESDLILFHHFAHARNFNKTCAALLGVDSSAGGVRYNGRLISIQVCPLGVDPKLYSSSSPAVESSVADLRSRLADYRVVSCIDALDPVKGLPQKLLAFEDFLRQNESFRKKVIFVVVIDRRPGLNHFWGRTRQLDKQVNRLVGRINGLFGTADYTPIQYMR
jgi:trehalose-6-phosphate synthase